MKLRIATRESRWLFGKRTGSAKDFGKIPKLDVNWFNDNRGINGLIGADMGERDFSSKSWSKLYWIIEQILLFIA